MSVVEILTLILSSLAILGTLFSLYKTHTLNRERDYENKKKEIRIMYLIDAYRKIEDASNRENGSLRILNLESAIADIQLFGDIKHIALSRQVAKEIEEEGHCNNLALLEQLRDDLREELGLQPLPPNDWHFLRFNIKNQS